MKFLKKIAISTIVVASMLAVTSPAFAAEKSKDLNVVIAEAGKNTEAELLAAKALLEKGGDSSVHDQILSNLNQARQHVKEFRYEQTEKLRQKLNNELKLARESFLKNDDQQSLVHVNQSLAIYAEMKKIYDAAH